ncbi:hypothetical protein BFS12_05100 [Gardnerella vaginalis]|nr:hypothetical protein BFS12_05100 [Gardnerella vaginalis]
MYYFGFAASCAIYERGLSSNVRYLLLFVTIYVRLSSKFSRMLDLMITYKRLITFRTFNRIRYKKWLPAKARSH